MRSSIKNWIVPACLAGGIGLGGQAVATSAPVADVLERTAAKVPSAARAVMIAAARAGDRLVVVGERGIVLLSDDNGNSWRQATVPVAVTLTAVTFVDAKQGWAVGHAGVVLHTTDGGQTWAKQLDGRQVGKLALKAAQTSNGGQAVAQQLDDDGPDKPFLDVQFDNAQSGWIVGAYGLILRTEDGGQSWHVWIGHMDNPKGLHLYGIRRAGSIWYVAGEQGYFARSIDGGQSFKRVTTPYRGSYFALDVLPGGDLIIAGLRGNAFRSMDQGATFAPVETKSHVSWNAVTPLDDGRVMFVNQAGQLYAQRGTGPLVPQAVPSTFPLTRVIKSADGVLIGIGPRGVTRLNAATAAATGK